MTTMLQGYSTEEQGSVVRFLWVKGLYAKDIHKNIACLRWEVFVS
jgi:hypothetical protein